VTLWLDAQISPALAVWLRMRFDLDAVAVRDIGLRDAEDPEIFVAAKDAAVTVMTKDSDFVDLLRRHGSPPQIVWLLRQHVERALEADPVPGTPGRAAHARLR
jgi:predicted nuclease of predicted toxin-antitoxin system